MLNPCGIESKIGQSELGTGGFEGDEDNLDEEFEVGGRNRNIGAVEGYYDSGGGRLSQSLTFFFFSFFFKINFILKDNIES